MSETYRIEVPITVIDSTEPGVSQADKKVSAFDKTVEKTQDRLEKMNRSKFQVAVDAVDKASSVVEKIKSGVNGLTSKAWSVAMQVKDTLSA